MLESYFFSAIAVEPNGGQEPISSSLKDSSALRGAWRSLCFEAKWSHCQTVAAGLGASSYNSFGNGWCSLREQITTGQLSPSNFLGANSSPGKSSVTGLSS